MPSGEAVKRRPMPSRRATPCATLPGMVRFWTILDTWRKLPASRHFSGGHSSILRSHHARGRVRLLKSQERSSQARHHARGRVRHETTLVSIEGGSGNGGRPGAALSSIQAIG